MQRKQLPVARRKARSLRPGNYIYSGRRRCVTHVNRFWRDGQVVGGLVHLDVSEERWRCCRRREGSFDLLEFALKARRVGGWR